MILTPLDYTAPTTVADAVAAAAGPGARFLAGGQSLLVELQAGEGTASTLVDLRKIDSLRGIGTTASGELALGAMSTVDDIARNPLVRTTFPVLAEAAAAVGDPQVRNRATLGGNLAAAGEGTDLPAALLALDARVLLAGDESLTVEDFLAQGAAGRLVTGVMLSTQDGRSAFEKQPRQAIPYAVTAVGVQLVMGATVESIRIGLTGPTQRPVRLRDVETALVGTDAGQEAVLAAFAALPGDLFSRTRGASAEYVRHVTGVLAARAVRRIADLT